ncbi:hypothetical protein GCK72_015932 [Caenorhabditis remanei]|uniref:Uncharacterized protein n=1 Tax=Caenorhabditis remanei TaxID=31234 RepID=A0A6A5GY42_CAERE|nr:hypothetical protein GCK72_015932 [Caenorhabditis remanei]KAF1759465.1 hypothetical protein GCK72_015932 [Caenorhabditis remanei]
MDKVANNQVRSRPSNCRNMDSRENPRLSVRQDSGCMNTTTVCIPRSRAEEIPTSSRIVDRYLEERPIQHSPPRIEVVCRAYEFVSHNRVWSTWILIEVSKSRERSTRAYELNGGYFLQKTPHDLGIRIPWNMTPMEEWAAYHVAICDFLEVRCLRPRYSTSRLSSLRLIRENDLICGCIPSIYSQPDSYGYGDICHIRQVAQKAMLKFHHKLQSRFLDSILSLKWNPS